MNDWFPIQLLEWLDGRQYSLSAYSMEVGRDDKFSATAG